MQKEPIAAGKPLPQAILLTFSGYQIALSFFQRHHHEFNIDSLFSPEDIFLRSVGRCRSGRHRVRRQGTAAGGPGGRFQASIPVERIVLFAYPMPVVMIAADAPLPIRAGQKIVARTVKVGSLVLECHVSAVRRRNKMSAAADEQNKKSAKAVKSVAMGQLKTGFAVLQWRLVKRPHF
jgi:hypothetical protein